MRTFSSSHLIFDASSSTRIDNVMESILSMHEDVYPLKSRHKKSSTYVSHSTNKKINPLDRSNIFSTFYQYVKTMISQRSVYLFGLLNLLLAFIAIICVTQAEDHPEYFSLVYIAIGVFIFYMITILFIIISQILETYQEKNHSLSSIDVPLLTSKMNIQSNPIPIEHLTKKTGLARSQTLPLTTSSIDPHYSWLTASSTLKDLNQTTSTRMSLLTEHYQLMNNRPKTYQSFALTTLNDQLHSPVIESDRLSALIKPIPFNYHIKHEENNKSRVKFSDY